MTKDINNQKLVQDIQDTGDEAARLLADLEEESNEKVTSQFELDAYRKMNANNSSSTHSGHRSFQSSRIIKEQEPHSGNPAVAIGVLAFFVFIAVVASVSQPSAEVTSTSSNSNSYDSSNSLVEKEKTTMTATQRFVYNDTLAKANQAVLKSEHKAAIIGLEILKSSQYSNLNGINLGLVNNKIIQANKQIKFLDQPGDSKYWEGEHFGYQWFDDHDDNNFKVFVAISKACKNPVVVFAYRAGVSDRKSKIVKTIGLRPKANISTMYVPYFQNKALWVEELMCDGMTRETLS